MFCIMTKNLEEYLFDRRILCLPALHIFSYLHTTFDNIKSCYL